jgi:hypothetical protein
MKKSISTDEINQNYRQYSFSESDKDNSTIYKLPGKVIVLSSSYKMDNLSNLESLPVKSKTIDDVRQISSEYVSLDENVTNQINVNHSINQNINIIPIQKKSWLSYLLKKGLLFIFHLLLISIFEIVFFFNVIVKYENMALYDLADSYINPIINSCKTLNQTDRNIFNSIFNYIVNVSEINQNGYTELNSINIYNNNILLLAWVFVIILFILFTILFLINYICKYKIKMHKIIIDNIFMICFLGLYEYMFFNTIIIKYKDIDSNILTKYVVDKINNCSYGQ